MRRFVLLFGVTLSCGGGPKSYYDGSASSALGASTNQATCATCHSNDGSQFGFSGTSLQNMAFHTSFKGGAATTLLSGANACVTEWMGGNALEETDPAWRDLKTYLESIASPSVTAPNPMVAEVLDDEAAYEAAYGGGSALTGESKYRAFCGRCHDKGLRLSGSSAPPLTTLAPMTIGRIAQKVRTSGPPASGLKDGIDKTPLPMPFFQPRNLPSQDLKDIIAFVRK